MASELVTESVKANDLQNFSGPAMSPLSTPQDSFNEAKKAFADMTQGNSNDAARAALPHFKMTDQQNGHSSDTASHSLLKTPMEDKGWTRGGSGNYYKDVALPKDWDSMSPTEKQNWGRKQLEQAEMDSKGYVGNEMPTGRYIDPFTGEHILVGWAGDTPSKSDQEWLKKKEHFGP